jgi:hypothetical protein
MLEQTNQIFTQAATRIAENIANFLPGLVVFGVILVVTVLVALASRVIALRIMRRLQADRRAGELGLQFVGDWSASGSPSVFFARLLFWAILILGLLVGLTALNATIPSRFAVAMFQYVPNVLAALLILVIGNLMARFLARSVLISAVNMQIQAARLLSVGVKWLVLVLTTAMALEQLRIGQQILLLAFGIVFGGIVLTLALAVGLGSKEMVSRSIERQMREAGDDRDTLNHV